MYVVNYDNYDHKSWKTPIDGQRFRPDLNNDKNWQLTKIGPIQVTFSFYTISNKIIGHPFELNSIFIQCMKLFVSALWQGLIEHDVERGWLARGDADLILTFLLDHIDILCD